ncbi:hypothetical protein Salat_1151200 [Sesamum alatum]|uniref:Uncharacterized protein n=1 Tax=Sesamum alatum TaxID=300844 RepID=A0AAE1YE05_9LAMI|nr:hypothetical protein Salat_1151200 [Sesamum alatum]
MWVPKKDLQRKKPQHQEDASRNYQNNAVEVMQKEERTLEDGRQKEKTNTSATLTDVKDLAMEDIINRQAPDFAVGTTRKEAQQAQVEDMQNAEVDTCLKKTSETGVKTSSLAENIELEAKNQDLHMHNHHHSLGSWPIAFIQKMAPTPNRRNSQQTMNQLQSQIGLNSNMEHQTLSINNPDPCTSIPKHPSKPNQPVLSNSAESTEFTITGPGNNYNNSRTTDEEFPPGFEPGFKFQSNTVTNSCSKPKRQRGRPKLSRQSPSKEQSDQIGAV